ncbi:uncharacterized protein LOC130420376 [Triplophysa dalaica]|uniref:uncharacterized protein LOC130420376 n=1 Tax=Triplophysa dalaica TaxID=1582913 RepID=UPI0024DF49FB|nr:uncharacterized protein LOC130420376 [Triplophysa dalaica]
MSSYLVSWFMWVIKTGLYSSVVQDPDKFVYLFKQSEPGSARRVRREWCLHVAFLHLAMIGVRKVPEPDLIPANIMDLLILGISVNYAYTTQIIG